MNRKYKTNTTTVRINSSLQELERELINEHSKQENFPPVFIIGAPRSGTTLFQQILISAFSIGYIDNISAKFWDAPSVGVSLSNDIFPFEKRVTNSYTSSFGFTDEITGPHEFGYFWQNRFKFNETNELSDDELSKIDVELLTKQIKTMGNIIELPMVFKNPASLTFQANFLADLFQNALFIFCFRDPLYNAQSILKSRLNYYDDINKWFSAKPKEYIDLINKDAAEQVVMQVYFCNKHIKNLITSLDKEKQKRYISINYTKLCSTPDKIINSVNNLFKTNGITLNQKKINLKSFSSSNKRHIDLKLYNKLQLLVSKYF